jgi:hypothetical protein
MLCFFSVFFHVASVSLVWFLSHLILDAVIRSMMSLLLILRVHLASISRIVCSFPCITLLHPYQVAGL